MAQNQSFNIEQHDPRHPNQISSMPQIQHGSNGFINATTMSALEEGSPDWNGDRVG